MSKQNTEVMSQPNKELLARLQQNTPQEEGYTRVSLPRLGFFSQDQTEGKGKATVVTNEAGTFYLETKDGDKYVKNEIGKEIELIVVYSRKKLCYFDSATEEYTSSSLYDNDNDEVTLFKGGKIVIKGYPEDLRGMGQYQKVGDDGKLKSKLEVNRVLYVLYNNELHELTIRGSSMYAFSTYAKSLLVTSVKTHITSTPEQKGSIEWNKMQFVSMGTLSDDELMQVLNMQDEIKDGIAQEKAYFAKLSQRDNKPLQVTESIEDVVNQLNAPKEEF